MFCMFLLVVLSGCMTISGNRVKLEKYPKVEKATLDKISLSHEYYYFDKSVESRIKYGGFIGVKEDKIQDHKIKKNTKCRIRTAGKYTYYRARDVGFAYQFITAATLYTLPFFWIYPHQLKAELISNTDGRVLKEYYFKENSYELRTFFWFFGLIYPPWWEAEYIGVAPEGHYYVQDKLSKALTRAVVSDAASFKECLK